MKLDEAIIHCEEKAEELNQRAESAENNGQYKFSGECKECASEHEQLAEWLKELKTLRKAYDLACKNCFGCWDAYENQIDCSDKSCVECFKEYYLQKAREENENT